MRKQPTTKLVALILLLAQVLVLVSGLPITAYAAASADTPTPFAYSNAALQTESVSMSGTTCTDAILFSMGYTGHSNGSISEVTYNFKGAYESLTFTAGFVRGDQRDATMTIIADGNVIYDAVTISYINVAKKYTVPLTGVSQLVIRFESSAYDKTHYAIGNIQAVPVSAAPDNSAQVSDEFYDLPRYLLQNAEAVTKEFSMGGYTYQNGYWLRMGYTGYSNGGTGKVSFNFNGNYKKLSFDIAKYMNRASETYTRSAYLTIEVDGEALPDYTDRELKWNDLSLPVEIDLTDVYQVTITVVSEGYDKVYWALGDIQLVSNGQAQGILLSTNKATLTDSAPSVDLNPRVYPSDAVNKNFTLSIDDPAIAKVDKQGLVYGRTKGSAVITATTEDGGHTATCAITSKVTKDQFTFTDVPDDAFYSDSVWWALYNEITKGYEDEYTFSANVPCTRAQIVTFLWRAAGQPDPTTTVNPFTDVSSDAYYYTAVLWAVENGITEGYGTATIFCPDMDCTRGQIVTFLWRYAGKPAPSSTYNPFTDVNSKNFYYTAVLWAVEEGITNGYGSTTTFCPDRACTRGEIVTFLYRAITM